MANLAAQYSGNAMYVTLFPVKQAAEIARTFVRHWLLSLGMPEEVIDNGCVIASELVTNVSAPRSALLYPRFSREELKGGFWA
jgi:hypothetical protein